METLSDGVCSLSHLGVIRVEGEDSTRFLQGQLTQDFSLLDSDHARLAAFCTAKGRMTASFIGIKRSDSEIWLICSRDLLAATLKRLSMFVLRAKVKLSDASEDFSLHGLVGTSASNASAKVQGPWSLGHQGSASLVQLYPANGVARALRIAAAGEPAPVGPALSLEYWLWTEVRSGVATLSAPVAELFVPQMLNYESVGGVNFKKGCYPGQEVVARSQFRGAIKRRAFVAQCTQALSAANEIFDLTDPSQPCGVVVQAAPSPLGGYDAIVSIQITSAEGTGLRLGHADGPPLVLLPLPYALLEDI
jgi:tRNA-modifying protein YgfZ